MFFFGLGTNKQKKLLLPGEKSMATVAAAEPENQVINLLLPVPQVSTHLNRLGHKKGKAKSDLKFCPVFEVLAAEDCLDKKVLQLIIAVIVEKNRSWTDVGGAEEAKGRWSSWWRG